MAFQGQIQEMGIRETGKRGEVAVGVAVVATPPGGFTYFFALPSSVCFFQLSCDLGVPPGGD
mgnify:CR=1 FL=1